MPTPEQLSARSALGVLAHKKADPEKIEEAREALRQANERAALDKHIAEVVAQAPRMTPEQADRLRRLFRYAPADE